ncbi:N-acetylmuramoyl-L-alanine amidase [Nocardiopsis potens]|uniref:N-acetylmuramoyl-L-alanine amidase n=1 Tax=Nocardiopsis potens TaxID=1246458 RepID=UPI00034748FF|nr:N-acetylmuramoyl-L-alanine amidase [Nocardiopsis potens]
MPNGSSTARPALLLPASLACAAVLALTGCSGSGGDPSAAPTALLPLPGPGDGDGSGEGGGKDGADGSGGEPSGKGGKEPDDGPLAGTTVLIDPGHNGGNAEAPGKINEQVPSGPGEKKACDTVGAESASGYPEHEFTLDLSLLLRDRLEAEGAEVVMTRADDDGVGPCVNERAEIGNEAGADAAISVHADGGPESGSGFHVIAPGEVEGNGDIVVPSARLAGLLRDAYAEGTGMDPADYIAEEGLDERTDLGGLNLSTVPKVFLEAGNMRNPGDAELLEDAEWRERAAGAITGAVVDFLTGAEGERP